MDMLNSALGLSVKFVEKLPPADGRKLSLARGQRALDHIVSAWPTFSR
jgi:hypothetical protein